MDIDFSYVRIGFLYKYKYEERQRGKCPCSVRLSLLLNSKSNGDDVLRTSWAFLVEGIDSS